MKVSWIILICLSGISCLSCGPSFRRTAQSDNAFERCFDLDYKPGAPIDQKKACWTGWLAHYVYNQPQDKIAYANLRLKEIADDISVPGPPGPPGSFDQRPTPPEKGVTRTGQSDREIH